MKNLFAGQNSDCGGDGLCLAPLGKGLALAVLLLAVCSLALAAAYCYTQLAGSTAHLLQLLVLGVAAFAGGLCAAKCAGRKGLWHGLTLGALLLVLLAAANLTGLAPGGITLLALLVKGLVLLLAGGLGGVIGVS